MVRIWKTAFQPRQNRKEKTQTFSTKSENLGHSSQSAGAETGAAMEKFEGC
jgi:hypothetical protein